MRTIVHLFCDVYLSLKSLQKVHKHCIIIILKEFVLVMAQKKNKMQLQDIDTNLKLIWPASDKFELDGVEGPPIIPLDMFLNHKKFSFFLLMVDKMKRLAKDISTAVFRSIWMSKQKVIGIVSIFRPDRHNRLDS